MKRSILLAVALGALAILLAACGSTGSVVTDAYSFAAEQGGNFGAFMVVSNTTGKDDALVSVKTTVSDRAELHTMVMDGKGGMMMQQTPSIPLPAGGKAELKPGSFHVMVFGANKTLKAGDTFPVTLRTQNGKEMTVQVTVRAAN
jgi:periplasmic copper chaperone A